MRTYPLLPLLVLFPVLALAQDNNKPAEARTPVPADGTKSDEGNADPFAGGGKATNLPINADRATQTRAPLQFRMETWEITALDSVRWLDGVKDPAALAKLRDDFLTTKLPAKLIFSPVMAIDQSTKGSNESIAEWIYPTEYEPPELPAAPPAGGAAKPPNEWQKWLESTAGKFACPTSFETRNTGQTLEVEAQPVTIDAKKWDLAISFDCVEAPGSLHYGEKDSLIEMPMFQSFRTGGLVRLKETQWRLLSVMEPPRGLDGKPSDKRWITLVRIDPSE
ncbi:hypothetical protein [Haloferula sp. BvORR071]|uniref:hypothetical protein n=1 Tax=Haloferula sp. BvORR071 TaxID=1396141 RepID=UPI000551CC8F|nr:hypothetical protein [Haloferula sp. BvORR071]